MQFIISLFGIIILLLFSPIVSFVVNTGTYVGMSLGAVIFLTATFWNDVKRFFSLCFSYTVGKIAIITVGVAFSVIVVSAVTAFACIIIKSQSEPPKNSCVVVLGCKIEGDKPGKFLGGRLDAAAEYLSTNEGSVCIVSGGKGSDELYSEAYVMKQYLISKGISQERIFEEALSDNTDTNMRYVAELVKEKGWGTNIAVVTDFFHEYRAGLMAKKYGLEAYAVPSYTFSFSVPTYIFREICGILEHFFFP